MLPQAVYLALIIVTLCGLSPLAIADSHIPQPIDTDNRIKAVTYHPNQVVPIDGLTFTSTQVQFANDEYILNIEGGDTAAWQVTVHETLPNLLYLKPTIVGSNTNMTVVTNKRHYFFDLRSGDAASYETSEHTYAVRFRYPEEEERRLSARLSQREQQRTTMVMASKNPQSYNWAYSFNGNRQIIPDQIFDDGEFTYFRLRPGQVIPAIFAVDNRKGEEAVVNFRIDGEFIIVQRTAPQFTLRHGEYNVASIFNDRLIQDIRHNRVPS